MGRWILVYGLVSGLLFSAGVLSEDAEGERVLDRLISQTKLISGTSYQLQNDIQGIRQKEMESAALTYGLQNAVYHYRTRANHRLEKMADLLDRIYHFGYFSVNQGGGVVLMVPSVIEAGRAINVENPKMAISTATTYQILKRAELRSSVLSWRDFLIQNIPPGEVHEAVKPKTVEEQAIWERGVRRGWRDGQLFAYRSLEEAVANLERLYKGMLLFLQLEQQGIVSMPFVAAGQPEILIEGERVEIGRTVFRITEESSFRDESDWRSLPGRPVE